MTALSRNDYESAINNFCAVFEFKADAEFLKAMSAYYERFAAANLSRHAIIEGVEALRADREASGKLHFRPKLEELLRKAKDWRRTQPRATLDFNRVDCDVCEGHGTVWTVDDKGYEYICRCVCGNGDFWPQWIPTFAQRGLRRDQVMTGHAATQKSMEICRVRAEKENAEREERNGKEQQELARKNAEVKRMLELAKTAIGPKKAENAPRNDAEELWPDESDIPF